MKPWEKYAAPESPPWEKYAAQVADVPAKSPARPEAPSGLTRGLRDPIDAGAQLLTKILPAPIEKAGNRLNNWLADKGLPLQRLPEGGVDQLVRESEQAYEAQRKEAGETGVDWDRLGGNVLSPVNIAAAARIPQAASKIGRLVSGAAAGAGFGALTPVATGNFWTEKAKQVGIGAGAGAALPLVTGSLARLISPKTRPEAKEMLNRGITPTPGQLLGGAAQVTEDKLTSVPILGDAISSARKKSLDEFNRAAYKAALDPIDGVMPRDIGRDGVRSVREQLSQRYDQLLPKLSFKADNQFAADLDNLSALTRGLPRPQRAHFSSVVTNQLRDKMTPDGLMNGARLKEVESELGRLADGYRGDSSFDSRQLGDAIEELQNIVRQNVERNNPDLAKELSKINRGWAIYTRLRDAAASTGAKDGKFTPAQLGRSVRAGDKTVGRRAYSEGDALLQDLTDTGQNVLSQKYPDSGTIGRLGWGVTAGSGGMFLAPDALVGGGLASLMYLPGGRQAIAALMARRPDAALPVANKVRRLSSYFTPAAVGFAGGPTE